MSEKSRTEYRLGWVDALRAFALVLVAWGHIRSKQNTDFFLLTSLVKIPLFFAITGFVFNDRNLQWRSLLKKAIFRIVIPWFVCSLVWLKMGYVAVIGHPGKHLACVLRVCFRQNALVHALLDSGGMHSLSDLQIRSRQDTADCDFAAFHSAGVGTWAFQGCNFRHVPCGLYGSGLYPSRLGVS